MFVNFVEKIKNMKIKNKKVKDPQRKNSSILPLIIVFCFPILLYLQTVNFGFTHFDDNDIILKNISFLSDFKNVSQAFQTDAFIEKSGSFYRPLQTLSYMIDIHLCGANSAWMFHLSNILLLGFIACLMLLLFQRFLIPMKLAIVGTLVYCVHPLFVSTIAWIPARGDLLLTLFSLASFLFLIDYLQNGKPINLFLHWIAFTIALFSKETAAILPLLFVIYYFAFHSSKRFEKKYLLTFLLYAISGICWFWLRSKAIGENTSPKGNIGILSIFSNLPTIPESLVKFFLPFDVNPLPAFSLLKTVVGLVIIIGIAILFFKSKERSKKEMLFCLLWFFILMIPPMIFKPKFLDYLDHRFFLPMFGILLFLLFIFSKKWFVKGDIKISWIIVVVFIFLCTFSFIKSGAYFDVMTFYNSAVDQNPNSVFAYNNRGIAKSNMGDKPAAIEDYSKAIAIQPEYAEAYNNRGTAKANMGDRSAIEDFNKAVALCPTNEVAYFNRGNVKSGFGDKLGAIEDFNKVIALRPDFVEAYYNRGLAKAIIHDIHGAIEDFNKAIAIQPTFAKAYVDRGNAKSNVGDNHGAFEDFNRAIEIQPDYAEAYNNKGGIMYMGGNLEGAMINFNKAIDINPKYLDAYDNRAITEYSLNDITGAMNDCEKVLSINPNDGKALNLYSKIQQEHRNH